MDLFFAFLSIIVIMGCASCCILFATNRYHQREMRRYDLEANKQNQQFIVMNELLKQKMLPPSVLNDFTRRERD